MCVTICEILSGCRGAVAGYGTANSGKIYRKVGVQIGGMIFQTALELVKIYNLVNYSR